MAEQLGTDQGTAIALLFARRSKAPECAGAELTSVADDRID
jgi:hypothetical protein